MAERLIDNYDAALFDLDGVIYLGSNGIDGAAEGLAVLRDLGVRIGFVTNNAARPPFVVAEQLTRLGIQSASGDVVTSAQAGARMMAERLPTGAKVLVVGTSALADEVKKLGLEVVDSAYDLPDAVVQGYDPNMTQPRIDEACIALQGGALWFATNTDATRPTERGQVPGAGAQIDAVAKTVPQLRPSVAGKPYPPLLLETMRRIGCVNGIFVGDRLDTDIEGANRVGLDSLFVFTGTHGMTDLLSAPPEQRPSTIGWDLRALLYPTRRLVFDGDRVRCSQAIVHLEKTAAESRIVLDQLESGREAQLDALWAILALKWAKPEVDYAQAIGKLDELR